MKEARGLATKIIVPKIDLKSLLTKCYFMGEQRASQLRLSHRASGLISMLRAAPIHRSTETSHVSFMINKNSKDKITITE